MLVPPTKVSVGAKSVTWVNYSPFDNDSSRDYLYAGDGPLFSVRPAPAIVTTGQHPSSRRQSPPFPDAVATIAAMSRDLHRPLREAWIVEAVRTPIGRYGGALASVRPDDLAASAIRAVVDRSGIDPSLIEDVILGCANQAGEDNRDVARMALLLAGLPVEVGGLTVNRLCGSGLQAVNSAAHAIAVGDGDVFIGGGVESMTRAPYVMAKPEGAYDRGERQLYDTTLGWRFVNPALAAIHYPYSMGETAENVAERWEVGRDLQDDFALKSQQKAVAAIDGGRFDSQIVPISVPQRKGDPVVVSRDEHPRADTSSVALARLKPAFRDGGTVTAGNSSGINDGASAVLLVEASRARELGLKPMARVVSTAVAGVDPAIMGYGPVPATRKALDRAGISVTDLDLVELNEAFASQSIVCINELGLDPDKVNVNGGAIALGHPLGMSGARLITMLGHELQRTGGRYGLATMCIGVGQGIATVIERFEG
jgi:3-oxoadipyl-CoA thiolase